MMTSWKIKFYIVRNDWYGYIIACTCNAHAYLYKCSESSRQTVTDLRDCTFNNIIVILTENHMEMGAILMTPPCRVPRHEIWVGGRGGTRNNKFETRCRCASTVVMILGWDGGWLLLVTVTVWTRALICGDWAWLMGRRLMVVSPSQPSCAKW